MEAGWDNFKPRIIILQGNGPEADDLAYRLTGLGYEVCGIAQSDREALTLSVREHPDLILLDETFGGGPFQAGIMEDSGPFGDIPVIILTTRSRDQWSESTRPNWPCIYIERPFHDIDLKIKIEMACHVNRLTLESRQAQESLLAIEEQLRRQTSLLSTLVNGIPDMIALQKTDHTIIFYNSAGYKFLGKTPAEVDGRKCYELIGRDKPCVVCATERAIYSKKIETIEKYMPEFKTWLEVRAIPVADDPGNVNMVVEILRDITETRHAEESLRESEQLYRGVFDSSAIGMAIVSPDGYFLRVNSYLSDLLGYSRKELTGKHINDVTHPEDRPIGLTMIHNLIREKPAAATFEKRYLHKSGKPVWSSVTTRLICHENGEPAYFITQILDLRALKDSEEMRRKEADFAKHLLDTAQVIILVLDIDGRIVQFNPYMEVISGYKLEEVKGKDWVTTFLPDTDHFRIRNIYSKAIEGVNTRGNVNPIITKDGREIDIEWYDNHLKDAHGNIVGILAVGRDLTEQKAAQQEKEKLQTQLQQAQKMEAIGSLAGGIAHDFNNILGAIMGYIELSQLDTPQTDPNYQNLQHALNASYRARELIKQILTFSRQTEIQILPFSITPIIKEAMQFLRSSLPTTIEIRHEIKGKIGAITGDPTQIHQVIMNLCTNAAHAMREKGGLLEVKISEISSEYPLDGLNLPTGKYLKLTVSDTGHGMDRETLQRIFEPYFTTKESGEGTGMGLAVAHGIITTHGGTIKVYSEPEKGTTFHVYLPITEKSVSKSTESKLVVPTGTERILFVDDEEAIVDIGRKMLERLGYTVEVKTDSQKALERFRSGHQEFDLIITDQTMPGLTGSEMIREILKIRADIPIILCTGFSESLSAEKVKHLGIKAFLMKPLIFQELGATVRAILEGEKALD